VQAKVTVVAPEQLDEIVPLISRYANSQNRVTEADLRANDPFHVEVESLSRTVWTPAAGHGLRQTRWFYERARGQYRDALSREGTPARQRAWKASHPTSQRFTKTDLAKFENAWAQLPHEFRGARRRTSRRSWPYWRRACQAHVEYFERLVAKAILWKRTERLVTEQQFGGYRANLVAYAIAKLLPQHCSARRSRAHLAEQALDPAVDEALVECSHLAWRVLVDLAPSGANITEWAKQERCWRAMRDEALRLPPDVNAQLVALATGGTGGEPGVFVPTTPPWRYAHQSPRRTGWLSRTGRSRRATCSHGNESSRTTSV